MTSKTALPSAAFEPLGTRLFPKFKTASAVKLSGLASRCDWAIVTDPRQPHFEVRRTNPTDAPRTIFLSMRHYPTALRHLAHRILPDLTAPFILISGSEDVTLPTQTDARWPAFDEEETKAISAILASPFLVKWFAENLSERTHPKLEPLPVGLVVPDARHGETVTLPEQAPRLSERSSLLLCAHMVRDGDQWERRRRVSSIAQRRWSAFTTILDEPVTRDKFYGLLKRHAFVLCVEGGGLDPSPKAWEAIMHGAVPVIRRSCISPAYRDFECLEIDEWSPGALTREGLESCRSRLIAIGKDDFRADKVDMLGLDYWWRLIISATRSKKSIFASI